MIRPTTNKAFSYKKDISSLHHAVMKDAGLKVDDYSHSLPLGMTTNAHLDDSDLMPKRVGVRQSPFPSTFHKRGTTYLQCQKWRKPHSFPLQYGDIGTFNTARYVSPSMVSPDAGAVIYNGRVVKAGDEPSTSAWKYRV